MYVRTGQHSGLDPLAFLRRQLMVEQLLQRLQCDPATVPQHVSRDNHRKDRVDAFPAGEPRYTKGGKHSDVDRHIGGVVRSIRRDRGRASSVHHPGLHRDQTGGGDQAGDDDYEAKTDKLDWFREKQPLSGLCGEREGGSGKSGSLGKAGDRLTLAVAEAMIVIGWALGVAHTEEGGDRSGRVHEPVHRREKQRDRAGNNPGRELDHNQDRRDPETNSACEPAKARILLGR